MPALSAQIVSNFLNSLSDAQRQLLQECDRPPFLSLEEQAIVLSCSSPWLPLAIEQQDGIVNSAIASEMGVSVKIEFIGDPEAESRIRASCE